MRIPLRMRWGIPDWSFRSSLAATLALFLLTMAIAEAAIPSDALLERLKPNGFVNDFAGLLKPPQRDALEQRVRQLQQKTGAELAVVTVKSLEGGQIDDFTHKLFHNWGVGQKGKNNGVMLLVALDDRKMRIEVGYGLEPILPDALAGRIIDEDLRPLFRESRYADGISRAVERIAAIVERGEPPSRADAGKWPFRGSDAPLPVQIIASVMLSVFVIIGASLVGVGLGSKTFVSIIPGLILGGFVMFMGLMIGGFVPVILGVFAIVAIGIGFWNGRRNPGKYRDGRKRSGRYRKRYPSSGGWIMGGSSGWDSGSSGGGFSSSDSGGFGGGDSGGGGASGGW